MSVTEEAPPVVKNSKKTVEDVEEGDDDMEPAAKSRPSGDEKSVIYQIMYAAQQSQPPEPYNRPVTPLQITIPEGSGSPTVPVSCGTATGKMHLQLFVCPGIHQPCIELANELLSPKQFTIRGDKERQKDWKASIRVGRSSLRTHMEASTIDFYDHSNRCSGKCQSRNYVNAPVEREEVIQTRKAKRNADVIYLKNEMESELGGKTPVKTNGKKARGRPRGSVNKPRPVIKLETPDEEFFEEFFTDDQPPDLAADGDRASNGVCSSYGDIVNCLQNDPINFWSQMQQTGVIGHFCDDIIVHAINLKQLVLDHPVNSNTASMLTRTVFALGVQTGVVHRVQSIERSVHQQRKHEEMYMDIHSKVAEEQRKKPSSVHVDSDSEELRTAREPSNENL